MTSALQEPVATRHMGTATDPDVGLIPVPDTNLTGDNARAQATERTLNINLGIVETNVSEDTEQLGVKVDNLRVEVMKGNDGKPFLQVSGKVSASKLSASRAKEIVITNTLAY